MKQSFSRWYRSPSVWLTVFTALICIVLVVVTIVFWQPLSQLFTDKARVTALIEDAGIWGPLVFIGIQFLQVLVAPIPGQVVGVLAGALFGPLFGTLYSMIGALLGFVVIFTISRRLGRPFVERFVKREHLEKFDYLTKTNGPIVFFLIFLLPAFPDDIICYLAGLSSIPIRTLIVVSLAGRLPGFIVLSLMGAEIAAANSTFLAIGLAACSACAVIGYWQRERLEAWIRRLGSSSRDRV